MKQDNFNMGQDGMNGNQKKKMNGYNGSVVKTKI